MGSKTMIESSECLNAYVRVLLKYFHDAVYAVLLLYNLPVCEVTI